MRPSIFFIALTLLLTVSSLVGPVAAKKKKVVIEDDDAPPVAPPEEGGLPRVKSGDEEYESYTPPEHMKCDVCSAAAFWIHRAFKLRHKDNFLKKLKMVDIIDTVDDVCLPKTFSRSYGIKRINNRHRLSGGGLKWFYTQAPAVGTAMPGQWMNHVCREIQGEYGEEDLYNMFWKYHVLRGHAQSDIPFFRKICVKDMKKCSPSEALESYDGLEEKHNREEL